MGSGGRGESLAPRDGGRSALGACVPCELPSPRESRLAGGAWLGYQAGTWAGSPSSRLCHPEPRRHLLEGSGVALSVGGKGAK